MRSFLGSPPGTMLGSLWGYFMDINSVILLDRGRSSRARRHCAGEAPRSGLWPCHTSRYAHSGATHTEAGTVLAATRFWTYLRVSAQAIPASGVDGLLSRRSSGNDVESARSSGASGAGSTFTCDRGVEKKGAESSVCLEFVLFFGLMHLIRCAGPFCAQERIFFRAN